MKMMTYVYHLGAATAFNDNFALEGEWNSMYGYDMEVDTSLSFVVIPGY